MTETSRRFSINWARVNSIQVLTAFLKQRLLTAESFIYLVTKINELHGKKKWRTKDKNWDGIIGRKPSLLLP